MNSLNAEQRKDLNRFKERLAALKQQKPHGQEATDDEEKDEEEDKKKKKENPDRQGKYFTNRQDLARAIDRFCIKEEGLADKNKDGIVDWRQTYTLNQYDCASISAMTDDTLRRMAKAGFIDYNQGMGAMQVRGGTHAANWVPGMGHFDLTPIRVGRNSYVQSRGTPWYNFDRVGYTLYRDGFPDAGEYTPPGYKGPGRNTSPFAFIPGTGSGGGGSFTAASGAGFMNMLQQLSGRNGGGGLTGRNGLSGGGLTGTSTSKQPTTSGRTSQNSKQPSSVKKPEAKKTPAPQAKTDTGSQPATSRSDQRATDRSLVAPQNVRSANGSVAVGIPSSERLGRAAAEVLGGASVSPGGVKTGGEGTLEDASSNSVSTLKSSESTVSSDSQPLDGINRPAAWEIPANSSNRGIDALEPQKGFFLKRL